MSAMQVEQPPLLAALEALHQGGIATATGLVLTHEISFEQWVALLEGLGKYRDWTAFALGDAWIYGEERFGERATQAHEASGRSIETLTRYVWVATRVPPGYRRPGLRWTHHREVAPLTPLEQVRWLNAAEQHGWTVAELRQSLKEARALQPVEQPQWTPEAERQYQRAETDAVEHGYGYLVKGKRVAPEDVTVVRPTAPIVAPEPPLAAEPQAGPVVCPNCGTILINREELT